MRWLAIFLAFVGTPASASDVRPSPERCVPNGRWIGTGYQFDIRASWSIDLTLDLSQTKVGARVGSVSYPSLGCSGGLYRIADVNGIPAVNERIDHDPDRACLDNGSIRFACDGGTLEYRYYYPSGEYAAFSKLRRP